MRLLFNLDKKDYREGGSVGVRPSVRGIIVRGGKIAMVRSKKYDYYKFPGGGIEDGEDFVDALIREVREESGICVVRSSIREYGLVSRKSRGKVEDIFVQDNYYYLCEVEEGCGEQKLDDYEEEEGFTLEFVSAHHAIALNCVERERKEVLSPQRVVMLERESGVLRLLLEEGIVKD